MRRTGEDPGNINAVENLCEFGIVSGDNRAGPQLAVRCLNLDVEVGDRRLKLVEVSIDSGLGSTIDEGSGTE